MMQTLPMTAVVTADVELLYCVHNKHSCQSLDADADGICRASLQHEADVVEVNGFQRLESRAHCSRCCCSCG